jgi:hypothetical protein
MITASDWKSVEKGTLRGFCSLHLSPSGLVLRDCMLHHKADGSRWIGLPSRPQMTSEGTQRLDPKTGKPAWIPVVEIKGSAERKRFQEAALAAIDKLLAKGGAP